MSNISTGKLGEQLAYGYLREHGFTVIDANARTRFGEIDIVAERNSSIHFVEVKTRRGDMHGKPYEAVNYYKIRHMYNSAQAYALKNGYSRHKLCLDVVSIVLNGDSTIRDISLYENITL